MTLEQHEETANDLAIVVHYFRQVIYRIHMNYGERNIMSRLVGKANLAIFKLFMKLGGDAELIDENGRALYYNLEGRYLVNKERGKYNE